MYVYMCNIRYNIGDIHREMLGSDWSDSMPGDRWRHLPKWREHFTTKPA